MPVACQSRAPECPQAFGAQRLRGLRPSMVDNPSVTAAPRHLPLHKGGFDRCGGDGPMRASAPTWCGGRRGASGQNDAEKNKQGAELMFRAPPVCGHFWCSWHWPCMAQCAQFAPQEDFPAFFCRSRYTTMRDTMTSNTREIKMVPRFAANQSSMKSTPFKKNGGGNYLVLSLVASLYGLKSM